MGLARKGENVRHSTRGIIILGSALLAAGCVHTKEDLIPRSGPKMVDVYDAHMRRVTNGASGGSASDDTPLPAAEAGDMGALHRTAIAASHAQFPRLPNPDIVLYRFPHFAASGAPVPGYATVFPLYTTVEYALPGELEGAEDDADTTGRIVQQATPVPRGVSLHR